MINLSAIGFSMSILQISLSRYELQSGIKLSEAHAKIEMLLCPHAFRTDKAFLCTATFDPMQITISSFIFHNLTVARIQAIIGNFHDI